MVLRILIIFTLLLFVAVPAIAQDNDDQELLPDEVELPELKDDPIASMLDGLMQESYFDKECKRPRFPESIHYNFAFDSVPRYDDAYYAKELEKLDRETPFNLTYNKHVKGFIELYTIRKRDQVARMMGLAELYFPMFEELLDRYNMPLELKYLAIVESALNSKARSKAGAVGLWQFMYSTGRLHGLKQNSYLDDRCDPYKETVAACEYLTFLYNIFNDWEMALAAYNSGPGRVSRAIRKSGGKKGYWEIWDHLPAETRGYVPAFIAVNYVMTHTAEHNLYACTPTYNYYELDTITIKREVTFEQLSSVLGIPVEDLEYLNPVYKINVIPYNPEEPYTLTLPKSKIGLFEANEEMVYNTFKKQDSLLGPAITVKETTKVHYVRRGEYLGKIAAKYNCTTKELKQWNGIKTNSVAVGQKLVIHQKEIVRGPVAAAPPQAADAPKQEQAAGKPDEPKKPASVASTPVESTIGSYKYHVVQKGDTLWDIATANGVTVADLKKWNNLGKNAKLVPGKKLKIGVKS